MSHRAVFIDRDGVICENRNDYVKSWDEFRFIRRSVDALVRLSRTDYLIVVVTNQSCVGRGIVSFDAVADINTKMVETVQDSGGRINKVVVCPHTQEDGCACRKPKPGMLLVTASDMDIDLSQSYMVGDAVVDMRAGNAAGCKCIMVLTGRGLDEWMEMPEIKFQVAVNLEKAIDYITLS
jgi:histidinol-phosphate phosphatase family protein